MGGVLESVRKVLLRRETVERTDGELLESFLSRRDEAAFEALVRRHGPMVFGVCRRILNDAHDAEDAFQATFLVLMRRAGSILRREVLGSWLYGVAYRTALRAKARHARRRTREREAMARGRPEARDDHPADDLLPVLDREIHRLPEKYRLPVILCDLQGQSRTDAARALHLNEGTLSSRLARGREWLRRRLSRNGTVLSVAALSLLLARQARAVPPDLIASTVKSASALSAGVAGVVPASVVSLTDGVMKHLLLARLKAGAILMLAAGLVGLGGVALARHALTKEPVAEVARKVEPPPAVAAPEPPPPPQAEPDNLALMAAAAPEELPPRITPPPPELQCDPFYKKYLSARGLPVLGSEKVSDAALFEAEYVVNGVLEGRANLRQMLVESNVRIVVMHPTEVITDVPEKRHLRPKEHWDTRSRGAGGRITCCGEENLMQLAGDRFRGQNTLVHELAHCVHSQAMPRINPDFDRRLNVLYQRAMMRGLWKNTYAATSAREYWAEAVQCYFECNLEAGRLSRRLNSREGLKAYDPGIYRLVREVFGRNPWVYQPPNERE